LFQALARLAFLTASQAGEQRLYVGQPDIGERAIAGRLLPSNRDDCCAVHESVVGTEQTNRAGLAMSVVRGRPEVAFQGRQDGF
jgi:hypothetical protein